MSNFSISGQLRCFLLAATGVVALGVVTPALAAPERGVSATYYEEAQDFLAKGDAKAAIIKLKNALKSDPENVEARYLLGSIYLKLRSGASAEKEFRAALRNGLDNDKVMSGLARALLLQGEYAKVLEEIKPQDATPKGQASIYVMRGRAHLGLGDAKAAQSDFEAAIKSDPKSTQAKVGLAQVLAQQRKFDEANAALDEALSLDPGNPDGLVLKGEIARLRGRLEEAVASFDAALEKQPHNLPGLMGRAASLIDLNRDKQARADVDTIMQIAPKHPLAIHLLALLQAKHGDFAKADETLQSAGAKLDRYLPAVFLKGMIAYSLNNYEQAYYYLKRFLDAQPNHIVARRMLGATLVRRKNYDEAITVLTPLIDSGVTDVRVYALLGSAYMGKGDYSKATEFFEKASQDKPKMGSVRTQLALSKLAEGESAAAITELEKAIKLDPKSPQAAILLALVELRKGNFEGGLKAARELAKRFPDNPLADNLIGAALLGKKDIAGARAAFERALALKADYFPAILNLAQLDIREGKLDRARARYLGILKRNEKHLGAMMALANLAEREKKTDEARQWLEKAADANPEAVLPGLRLVNSYLTARDAARALNVANDLARRKPDNPRVIEALGRAQLASGEALSAVNSFTRLAELAPNVAAVHLALARAQMVAKNTDAARKAYQAALAINSGFAPAAVELAGLEVREKRYDAALEIAKKLRQKLPGKATGDLLFGDIYMAKGDTAKALASYAAAYKIAPSAGTANRLFRAKLAHGETDAAFQVLEKWVASHPDDARTRYYLAGAYLAEGRYPSAITQYETLLAKTPDNGVLLNNLAWLQQKTGDARALETAEKALRALPESLGARYPGVDSDRARSGQARPDAVAKGGGQGAGQTGNPLSSGGGAGQNRARRRGLA